MLYADVKNNMPSLDLDCLLQVPRWREISIKGHILIVIMIIQRGNASKCLYLYPRSLFLVFLACFLVSARIPYRCLLPGNQSAKRIRRPYKSSVELWLFSLRKQSIINFDTFKLNADEIFLVTHTT